MTQIVEVFLDKDTDKRWNWLNTHLVRFTTIGSVLIFVTKKLNAEELAISLKQQDFSGWSKVIFSQRKFLLGSKPQAINYFLQIKFQ